MASLAVLAPNLLLRAWLAALLRTMGFDRVEEATDLEDLKRRANDVRHPEILLISLLQRDLGLDALIQEIEAWAPHAQVVFLAPALDMQALGACFAAGADGYLLEGISRDGLQHSLLLVSAGEKVFPSELATVLSTVASVRRERPTRPRSRPPGYEVVTILSPSRLPNREFHKASHCRVIENS